MLTESYEIDLILWFFGMPKVAFQLIVEQVILK